MEVAKISSRFDVVKQKRAPSNLKHTVVFSTKNKNMDAIETLLLDVSNPLSRNYGKYLSKTEIDTLSNDPSSFKEIKKYLDFQGIKVIKTSRNGDYITAEASVGKWEEIFGTEFNLYKQTKLNDVHLVRAEQYSLPDILIEHVESVFNVVQFPGKKLTKRSAVVKNKAKTIGSLETISTVSGFVTPELLNSIYDIRDNEGSSSVSQGVMESQLAYLSPSDLERFQKNYNLPVDAVLYNGADSRVTKHSLNETSCEDSLVCTKANIDVQYLMAVAQNTPTTFMYWNGADDWVEWLTAVADMESPPLVLTIDHLQNEHDTAASVIAAFNAQAMKLSLAGVTLVVPSGDDGVSGPDAREDVLRCGFFPQFPATSPYVTVVGATMVS
jgi:tripeptidyl-peptidase-1